MSTGTPLAALRRIATTRSDRPVGAPGERCDMCTEPVGPDHRHVVALDARTLMCACRACHLLFAGSDAGQRYRAVPDRYLSFPGLRLTRAQWDDLRIPVGLVFLFTSSTVDRVAAFYPGPAGATEADLPPATWAAFIAADPRLTVLEPDVEALLIRAGVTGFDCHLVPVDACYELVGLLRRTWRGFDGGSEARAVLARFFDTLAARSKPELEPEPGLPQ